MIFMTEKSCDVEKQGNIDEITRMAHTPSMSQAVDHYVWMFAFREIDPLKKIHEDAIKPENSKMVNGRSMWDEVRRSKMNISKDGNVTFSIPKGHYIEKDTIITFPLSMFSLKTLGSIVQATFAEGISRDGKAKKFVDGKTRIDGLVGLGLNDQAAKEYDVKMIQIWNTYKSGKAAMAHRQAEDLLNELNTILSGVYGVEPLVCNDEEIALYLNKGDTYDTTVLYNKTNGRFEIVSWGAFFESWERGHRRCS